MLVCLTLPITTPDAVAQMRAVNESGIVVDTLAASVLSHRLGSFIVAGSESIVMNGVQLDTLDYALDYRFGHLSLRDGRSFLNTDTLVVSYRRFPFAFADVYRRHEVVEDSVDQGVLVASAVEGTGLMAPAPGVRRTVDPFGNVNLKRSGSITRGVITGNRRDVSVESGLRMQLSGEVADGVHVQAMLTDENTPIQPEGVTRRLNEFDRVSISIENEWGRAELGDFNLSLLGTTFGNFDRKLQGLGVTGVIPDTPGRAVGGGRISVAGATSRGIFQSHEIQPIDGVQGPYRLRGKDGERFIIVIAGSEVVYMDGARLERGESNDYVIDYQTGEISFTPKRLITDDRRIQVEFQYTTIEFTRTLIGARADMEFWQRVEGPARVRIGSTFIREADSRDFNAELGLTAADSLAVVGAGDALAFRSGAEVVAFDPEAPFVQYALQTIDDGTGGIDSIFVPLQQAPAKGEPVYRVRFTEVGPGRGSYNRVGRSVNGLQYEYVGTGLGEYEPIRILPRPRQQRLVGFHGSAEILPRVNLFGEWASSLNDQNRLSNLDRADDVGKAWLGGVHISPFEIRVGDAHLGQLSGSVSRQHTGPNFIAFARTRPVEFARRWNLNSRSVDPLAGVGGSSLEQVDEAIATYAPTESSRLSLEGGRILLGESFSGARRSILLESNEVRLPHIAYRLEDISSTDSLVGEDGLWFRQFATIRKPLLHDRLTPQIEFEHERRRQRVLGTDSLALGSMSFLELRPGVTWATERYSAGAEFEVRTEDDWLDGRLEDAARAWTWQSNVSLRPSENFKTDATLGYRVRRFTDRFRVEAGRRDTESIILRWNGRHTPLERAIETDWLYEALTERTPTMQEIYIQTTPDYPEAQYVWEDANGDGLVQVDEFLPELTPNEGTYARTFIPSDSLTSVVSVQARLRFEVDPARIFGRDADGIRRAISQVSSRTVVELQEQNRSPDITSVYLLRPSALLEPGLTLNGRARIQQELFLFRRNSRYGLDLSYSQVRALNELASGRETRRFGNWRAQGRYRLASTVSGTLTGQIDLNKLDSDAFSSRRYDLLAHSVEPMLIVVPTRGIELRGSSIYSTKRDRSVERSARVFRVPLEVRFMQAGRLQLTGRFEWASVEIDGDATGLARYELTDGRGPGTSYLWHLNGQYRLNEYLRASVAYDGRAPEGAPVLHTLRLQMSAVF